MNEKRPLTFALFSFRLLSGLTGGVAGTLALFLVYFLLVALVPPSDETQPLSAFIVIVMSFVATLVANTITGVMVTFLDSEKYKRRKTILTQIFIFNLILFFITIPLYLLGIGLNFLPGIAAIHFLLSAFISALIMEVLAGTEYALIGIYSASLGIFVSLALALLVLTLGVPTQTLLFVAMPAVWFILQISAGFTELIYDNFLRFYGVDALNVNTDLGGDNEKEMEDEEDDEESNPPTKM